MRSTKSALVAFATTAFIVGGNAQSCASSYSSCNPQGATATATPTVGSDLSPLYVDLLHSISGVSKHRRLVERLGDILRTRDTGGGVCCVQGTQCLLMQGFNLPFCYDKFTTNYFLPGGAQGQIVSGNYTSPDGSHANLLSGDFTLANGASGNIYGAAPASKPNTATLSVPTQFTGTGIGGAIPSNSLGQLVTYTTTIPGTTKPPSTIAATTVTQSLPSGVSANPVSTVAATTIPGTTVPPQTTTIVTQVADSSSSSSSSSAPPSSNPSGAAGTSSTAKAGAGIPPPRDTLAVGAAGFGFILLTLFGL